MYNKKIISLLTHVLLDMVLTWIKYSENFIVIPGTTTIIANPFDYWTELHKNAAQVLLHYYYI